MILWLLLALVILSLVFEVAYGAPFVPVMKKEIPSLLGALKLQPGQTLVDLGCGDGRILKAAARQQVKGIGYEINPWFWLIAKINCYQYRSLVKIRLANYWRIKLPPAEAIFVFSITHYMARLERKLASDIKRSTKVLSYIYALPERTPQTKGRNYYLYHYGS